MDAGRLRPALGARRSPTSRLAGLGLAAAMPALALFASPPRACARSFDYLHIEADSGASSGGHAAIRFDDDTYHFVYAEPGIIQAVRDPSGEFDYIYRAYDNRGIDVERVEVSDDTYQTLRSAFLRRHLVQDAQLDALDSARRDRMLIDALAGSDPGESLRRLDEGVIALKGAGYFFDDALEPSRDAEPESSRDTMSSTWAILEQSGVAALSRLRADTARALGERFLDRRRAEAERAIREHAYACTKAPRLERGRIPGLGALFADRYRDLLLTTLALDVLAAARPPVLNGFRTSTKHRLALGADALASLRKRADRARLDITRLVASTRQDYGFALLVAMARLVALEASIASRQLVVPDTFRYDGDVIPASRLLDNGEAAAAVLTETHADVLDAWNAFVRSDPGDEPSWSRLEAATNVYWELAEGLTDGARIRLHVSPVPARAAAVNPAWPRPSTDVATLEGWASCADATERELRAEVERLYAYDLVSRNCVTEIFATIDGAFEGAPRDRDSSATQAQVSALGGHVDGEQGFNFVPFVSARTVRDTYRVSERIRLPSYRRYWLDRMLEGPQPLRTRLRESNTLTARLYQPGSSDVFLFFTDDAPLLRPLLGASNLAFAAGATAAGTIALPFDRGALALGGLRGMVFSLPELAFVSLRKGSNAIVPRDWTATAPAADSLGTLH